MGREDMMPAETPSRIVFGERGRPWIDGTDTKVIEVVLDRVAYGWSPEAMHREHPHLTLSDIHADLSYYADHRAGMDEAIRRQVEEVEQMRAAAGESPLAKRLRAEGKLKQAK